MKNKNKSLKMGEFTIILKLTSNNIILVLLNEIFAIFNYLYIFVMIYNEIDAFFFYQFNITDVKRRCGKCRDQHIRNKQKR